MSRIVLITGAAGGIGKSLCRHFVAAGDTVLAQDRDAAGVQGLVDELGADHCRPVIADLTDGAALRQALAAVTRQTGPVEVLVANAGTAEGLTLETISGDAWRRDMDINLNGTFESVTAVLPDMKAMGRGRLILIGSVNGMTALGHPAYSAAKAGLISYTKALAMEYGKFGIRANIICPGTVKTPAWQARVDKNPHVFDDLKKWYPLQDFASPEDIAAAAGFLASDAARMITGVALPVDGGLMAGNRVMAEELTLESI